MGKGYNKKNDKIKNQILSDQELSRNNLLEREKQQMSEKKLTFSTTAFQNIKSKMDELHILLTPNKEHKKVYPKVSVAGFQNGKTLNPLSANPIKWSNTLKQFVGNLLTKCLCVFDHFVKLAHKGLKMTSESGIIHDAMNRVHKLTSAIFEITQKPLYITSSNLVR